MMSTGELLSVDPLELKFPFELKKQISSSLVLSNNTADTHVAFKVKTTNPNKYCVRPNTGILEPRSTCDVIVTMQAQKEAPPHMQCKDKFLLQSVKTNDTANKEVTAEMFNKEAGHVVEECKLRVIYVAQGSEEGSSPRPSFSENGNTNASDAATKSFEPHEKSSEATSLISKLTEENNSAIQKNNKLRQQLELLKLESSKSQGGMSFVVVVFIGLLGLILGYIMRRS